MIKQKIILSKIVILVMLCFLTQAIYGKGAYSEAIQSVIQIPNKLILKDYLFTDVNNDGLKDLVLSVGDREKRFNRSLRVHYQRESGRSFILEPDFIVPLTADVIAYACADIDPSPGAEIILLTGKACFGYRLQREKKNNLFKIIECDFLWQLPDPQHVFSWQDALIDVNGDQKVDLLFPQSNALRILMQKGSKFISTPLLEMPKEKGANNVHIPTNGHKSPSDLAALFKEKTKKVKSKPLVSVSHSVNVPLFEHFNGDEYIDILMQTPKHLYVWEQKGDGLFGEKPVTLRLPQSNSKSSNGFGLSTNQYILDLNGDKRCDYIMFSRSQNREKIFTQILIYINKKSKDPNCNLVGKEGLPHQLIKIAGFPNYVRFTDINCDGYPDLSFSSFSPDLLNQLKTVAMKTIKLQFLAFISNKGDFSRNPDITQDIYLSLDDKSHSHAGNGHFFIDYNGDGLLDLLVRDTQSHIGLYLLKKSKNGINIETGTVWDMAIPEKARIVYETTKKGDKPLLLLLESNQLTYVRFK